jgi:hypothetical protein
MENPKKIKKFTHFYRLLLLFVISILFLNTTDAQEWERLIDREADYPVGTIIPSGCDNTTIDGTNYDSYTITLPPQSNTGTFVFTLPLFTGINPTDVALSFPASLCACAPPMNPSGVDIQIMNPNPITPGGFISFTVRATKNDGSGNWDEQKYQFKIKRKDLKFILVLDHSGSMSLNVHGTTDSRWVTLKNAVASFLSKLEEDSQLNDSLGITYFSTDVSGPTTIPSSLIENEVFGLWNSVSGSTVYASTLVVTDMNAHGPTNMTAVGKGLSDAKDKANSNTDPGDTRRVIILFTDGLQNTDPLVDDLGQSILTTPTATGLNDVAYPLSCDDNIIRYYVISTLPTGDDIDYLVNIAANNCGYYQSVFLDGGSIDLTDLYDNNFKTMLSGSSPQIVSSVSDVLTENEKVYEFEINDYISSILFELNYKTGDRFAIRSIHKDTFDLTSYFKNKDMISSNFLMRTLELPMMYEKYTINSKGIWKVKVTSESRNPFKIKCFVDDHLFNYHCTTDETNYTVGDTIHFKTRMLIGNDTLWNADCKVSVLLLKPGDDIGHLLATYANPDNQLDTIDVFSSAEQKFINLLNSDTAFYNALKEDRKLIELMPDDEGIYREKYTDTELTGFYHAIYLIEAMDPNLGTIIRTELKSLRFKFGLVDITETDIDVDVSQGDDGQNAVITVKPINKFGYFIGPGYLKNINIKLDPKQGRIINKIDHLDGSYSFEIVGIPQGIDPADFPIYIYDEVIIPSEQCYPVTYWYYLILIGLIILFILTRKIKIKLVRWFLLLLIIIWVVYIGLRYFEMICYKFL